MKWTTQAAMIIINGPVICFAERGKNMFYSNAQIMAMVAIIQEAFTRSLHKKIKNNKINKYKQAE